MLSIFEKFSSFKVNKVIEQWLSWAWKVILPSPCPVIVSNNSPQSQDTSRNRTRIPARGTWHANRLGLGKSQEMSLKHWRHMGVFCVHRGGKEVAGRRHSCLRTIRQPSLKQREAQRGRLGLLCRGLWSLSALLSTFPCSCGEAVRVVRSPIPWGLYVKPPLELLRLLCGGHWRGLSLWSQPQRLEVKAL